jgi:penicillin amidase
VLPASAVRFIVEPDPTFEAALDGSRLTAPPMPTPAEYDLRALGKTMFERVAHLNAADPRHLDDAPALGSNNWAVAGARTVDGGALLANDMHLGLRVPNTWYRARLVVSGDGLDISGVTLPGVPAVVAGSNGHVAWGFTNSYGDFQDLVRLEPGPEPGTYLAPGGPRRFEEESETLEVAHGEPEKLVVRKTIWGPVIAKDGSGHELALAWTAHRDGATDMAVLRMERARNLDDAAAIAGGAGMPAQNVMIADSAGRIGWVLSGKLPRRQGIDPSKPSSWSAEGAGWDGWVPSAESPRLLDPQQGYAWSANARVVGGADYARIGDGSFAPAARAREIRADCKSSFGRGPQTCLRSSWTIARIISRTGSRSFSPRSAGRVKRRLQRGRGVERPCGHRRCGISPFAGIRAPRRRTRVQDARGSRRGALAGLRLAGAAAFHRDRLAHGPRAAAKSPRSEICGLGQLARRRREGNRARTAGRLRRRRALPVGTGEHRRDPAPLEPRASRARALARHAGRAAAGRLVDAARPVSEVRRFRALRVSPGREAAGYLHMPGGQSGHPLSPFYRAGHDAWVRGEPTPFLPASLRTCCASCPRAAERDPHSAAIIHASGNRGDS